MNMHVSVLAGGDIGSTPLHWLDDPMPAAVERWRAANRALQLACKNEDDQELIDACMTVDVQALTAVLRTTATTGRGWTALMGILDETCGEYRLADLLDCLSRSYRAIFRHLPESEL